ncbi:MAG: MFS transporter [Gemmiger sp.]|nr:MFS transporter [Gemmiger sp.]
MKFLKGYTKSEISWMMYDWANSAHSVIIVTILPIFFDTVAGYTADSVYSMSTWGYATSLAMAIVALSAPFVGVFGDILGMRKKLFAAFVVIGVVACAGMAFTPGMDFTSSTAAAGKVANTILVLYIISVIGFDASCVYYDAFLTDITTESRMDQVSTLGYGLGYIGGSTIPLVIFLVMNLLGVPTLTCLAVIFALTAVWWLVFSLPLIKNCEQTSGKPYEKGDVGRAIRGVGATIREIGQNKAMLVYILAYFFYIDGVHTIISMSTVYGTNLGLNSTDMLLALLLVQLLGLPFCLLYMRLSAKFGARTMVGVGICVYMFICVFGFFMRSIWQFWVLAILCATSQGGIQALSRSMFGKLIPDKNRSGEFFGFFDIFGKFSSIMGPTLVGVVSAGAAGAMLKAQGLTAATATAEQVNAINAASSPYGILSILLIMAVGGILYFVVLPKYLKK